MVQVEPNPKRIRLGSRRHIMGLLPPRTEPENAALMLSFAWAHLPPQLQPVSRDVCELALTVVGGPQNEQTHQALWRLLEAKDCAVRAVLPPGLEDEEPERAPLLAGESISAAAGRPLVTAQDALAGTAWPRQAWDPNDAVEPHAAPDPDLST